MNTSHICRDLDLVPVSVSPSQLLTKCHDTPIFGFSGVVVVLRGCKYLRLPTSPQQSLSTMMVLALTVSSVTALSSHSRFDTHPWVPDDWSLELLPVRASKSRDGTLSLPLASAWCFLCSWFVFLLYLRVVSRQNVLVLVVAHHWLIKVRISWRYGTHCWQWQMFSATGIWQNDICWWIWLLSATCVLQVKMCSWLAIRAKFNRIHIDSHWNVHPGSLLSSWNNMMKI